MGSIHYTEQSVINNSMVLIECPGKYECLIIYDIKYIKNNLYNCYKERRKTINSQYVRETKRKIRSLMLFNESGVRLIRKLQLVVRFLLELALLFSRWSVSRKNFNITLGIGKATFLPSRSSAFY